MGKCKIVFQILSNDNIFLIYLIFPRRDMKNKSTGTRILYTSLLMMAIGTIIFSILIIVSYSLLIGWLVGSISVILTYLFSLFIIKILLQKKEYSYGMFLTFARIIVMYLFHIGIIIGVVAIDKAFHGYGLTEASQMSDVYSPINIFRYLGGVSIVSISTIIAHISFKRGA